MDFGGNLFCLSNGNTQQNGTSNRNGNGNGNVYAWDSWEPNTSYSSTPIKAFTTTAADSPPHTAELSVATGHHEHGLANALMFLPRASLAHHHRHSHLTLPPPYSGDGSHVHPDPHLTCLKLGKRHYFEDANDAPPGGGGGGGGRGGLGLVADKKGKGYYGSGGAGGVKAASLTAATVPRCQVEGCHVALLNAKEYHRRHKVCEMHSKAPKVVVLGIEQRFCQQCSRFHVVSEFDDSKRSCRRRLAGHNERRRKSSHDSVARNSSQAGCALSLLSSRSSESWLSSADLSIRSSAALRELIAENRAALMARHFVSDRDHLNLQHHAVEEFKEIQPESSYFLQNMFPQAE